ncbi:hypothetical protein AB0J01_27695 [Streptomyces sp. NPDC050204]|uniref:DUF6197 family protein n=1 Tax=Streptomyces sp. NPDC050204 TaxID=3155514 RepID=UPI0034208FEF
MNHTPKVLRDAADLINRQGLHSGDQFVGPDGELDLTAAIFKAVALILPGSFRTNADTAIAHIKDSPGAMAAIRAVYDTLEAAYPEVHDEDDVIDTVSYWATEGNFGPDQQPPSTSEVIGRLLRVADALEKQDTTLAA